MNSRDDCMGLLESLLGAIADLCNPNSDDSDEDSTDDRGANNTIIIAQTLDKVNKFLKEMRAGVEVQLPTLGSGSSGPIKRRRVSNSSSQGRAEAGQELSSVAESQSSSGRRTDDDSDDDDSYDDFDLAPTQSQRWGRAEGIKSGSSFLFSGTSVDSGHTRGGTQANRPRRRIIPTSSSDSENEFVG